MLAGQRRRCRWRMYLPCSPYKDRIEDKKLLGAKSAKAIDWQDAKVQTVDSSAGQPAPIMLLLYLRACATLDRRSVLIVIFASHVTDAVYCKEPICSHMKNILSFGRVTT
jgi:hypothetical protein